MFYKIILFVTFFIFDISPKSNDPCDHDLHAWCLVTSAELPCPPYPPLTFHFAVSNVPCPLPLHQWKNPPSNRIYREMILLSHSPWSLFSYVFPCTDLVKKRPSFPPLSQRTFIKLFWIITSLPYLSSFGLWDPDVVLLWNWNCSCLYSARFS